jgi:hypothetical protein
VTTSQAEPTVEELAAIFGYELKRRPLDPVEVAELCRYKNVGTLVNQRTRGDGPRFFKLDKHVLYSEVDVLRWLHAGMATNTSQYPTHMQKVPGRRYPHRSDDTSGVAVEAIPK